MNLKVKYQLLGSTEFDTIAKNTGYASNHVRQVLRGYINLLDRHAKIITEADKILEKKLQQINDQ